MSNIAHLAAQSARQIQQAQAVVTHNLANSGTTGFKADLYQAQSSYVDGGAVNGSAVAGSVGGGVDYSSGAIAQTGRDLDIAITGEGWFQVVADDGTLALSRRGELRVGTDGTISIVPMGELPTNIVALDRLMLVNPPPEALVKGADGMIRVANMDGLEPDANVRVAVGALETSNVSPVGTMVEMITLARSFEQHIQTIKSAEELDASSASIMKLE